MIENIQTPYGIFVGVTSRTFDANGRLEGLKLCERNLLMTHVGDLVPLYEMDMRRKDKPAVTFHSNGMIRSVSLQEQQEIETPIGVFPAELVIFYETGELSRCFILDGQISGFWTEGDERELNIPLSFDLPFTSFRAMLIGISFHRSGTIRSVGLFPGETIWVSTLRYGYIPVRNGFSLYEDGIPASLEPATPVELKTPIGGIITYDPYALGIHADNHSLRLDRAGRVVSLVASAHRIVATTIAGERKQLTPWLEPSPLDPEQLELKPLRVAFDYDKREVTITDTTDNTFLMDGAFEILPYTGTLPNCTAENCAQCTLCLKERKF